jgi:hypothetical protein
MQTFSLNSLSESFECDRGTLVKALRDVPADFEKSKTRPEWKISTAARALDAHRHRTGRADRHSTGRSSRENVDGAIDPRLQRHYDAFDEADASMRRLKTVEARRQAAISMGPQIAKMDTLQRQLSLDNGNDEELTELRSDRLFLLCLRGLEGPCNWSMSDVWEACDVRE